jgi:DNA-binding MarR family transcriptional regulator
LPFTALPAGSVNVPAEHQLTSSLVDFVSHPLLPPRRRGRQIIHGNFMQRAKLFTSTQAHEQPENERIAWVSLRLGQRRSLLLEFLYDHPLVSVEELSKFLGLQTTTVEHYTTTLRKLGFVLSDPTARGLRLRLGEHGLAWLAARHQISLKRFIEPAELTAPGETIQRGLATHRRQIQHLAAIYTFFTELTLAPSENSQRFLAWWESNKASRRLFSVQDRWFSVHPDAQGEYLWDQTRIRFWLTYVEGVPSVRDLTLLFRSYARYATSRWWQGEPVGIPYVFIICAGYPQERTVTHIVQQELAEARGYVVRITTEALLHQHGPLGKIWSPIYPPMRSRNPDRRAFYDIHQERR